MPTTAFVLSGGASLGATAVHAVSLLTQQRLIADVERHMDDDVELIVLRRPARSRSRRSTSPHPRS